MNRENLIGADKETLEAFSRLHPCNRKTVDGKTIFTHIKTGKMVGEIDRFESLAFVIPEFFLVYCNNRGFLDVGIKPNLEID